jgi:iron complex transport system substrate-binding protein
MPELRPIDHVSGAVVDAAYHIHRALGPGLLESVYEILLANEIVKRGFPVERQTVVSFDFDGHHFSDGLRLDLLVDRRVVVEIKSCDVLSPVHAKQLLTYLRLLNLQVGLLVNFGGYTLRDGLRRIVNNYSPPSSAARVSPRLRVTQTTPDKPQAAGEATG